MIYREKSYLLCQASPIKESCPLSAAKYVSSTTECAHSHSPAHSLFTRVVAPFSLFSLDVTLQTEHKCQSLHTNVSKIYAFLSFPSVLFHVLSQMDGTPYRPLFNCWPRSCSRDAVHSKRPPPVDLCAAGTELILLLLYRPGRSFVVDVFSPFAGYTSRPTDLTDRFHRVRFLGREGSSGGSIALDPVISFGPAAFPCIANELLVCVSISSVADQSPSRRNLDTHKEKRNIINNNNNSEMANRFLGDEMEGETLGN